MPRILVQFAKVIILENIGDTNEEDKMKLQNLLYLTTNQFIFEGAAGTLSNWEHWIEIVIKTTDFGY